MRRALVPAGRRALALGRGQARLAVTGRLGRVALTEVTDEFGFALAPGGWNYYTDLLAQVEAQPGVRLEDTAFFAFFDHPATNAVRDLNDLLDLGSAGGRYGQLPRFWLGTYPWGGLLAGDIDRAGPAYGWAYDQATGSSTRELWGRGRNLWYEPRHRFTLDTEWDLTLALHRSIRAGYRPLRARGFPRVAELRGPAGRRFIIVDGHHRLCVLAHLGARRVVVEREAVIERADAGHWYHVRHGHCSRAEATAIFDALFQLDGSERWQRLQLRAGSRRGP